MKILVADDHAESCRLLGLILENLGYEVVMANDGLRAWELLQGPEAPRLAILDWMMPGVDGVTLCRQLRESLGGTSFYLILLTGRGEKEDLVAGLEAGADDYLLKPVNMDELGARIRVGVRTLGLQEALASRVRELEAALAHIEVLHGILPICMYCKRIRDDQDYWQQVEAYISAHSDARFSHSICPDCYEQIARPALDELRRAARPDASSGSRPDCSATLCPGG
jgi:CheY-like chemotaxis protein